MSLFRRVVEDKIQKAMDAGQFDNLPGKGKPLKLEDNPYEPPEWRAAHQLLKNNDFTLPWIETWDEIARDREALRKKLREDQERLWRAGREAAWELAKADFAGKVLKLNRRILEYNLSVPAEVFQKPLINPENEMRAALGE